MAKKRKMAKKRRISERIQDLFLHYKSLSPYTQERSDCIEEMSDLFADEVNTADFWIEFDFENSRKKEFVLKVEYQDIYFSVIVEPSFGEEFYFRVLSVSQDPKKVLVSEIINSLQEFLSTRI